MHKRYLYFLALILSYYSSFAYADDSHLQRKLFWQARQFLLTKHYQQFEQLKVRLLNYPLYPYLVYIKLKQQLAYQNSDEIDDFLETYNDTPLAHSLRVECLTQSAKNKDWSSFLHYYRPDHDNYDSTFQCHYFNALLATHQERKAYQAIPKLWLTLNSPSTSCKKVFSHWESVGGLNRKLIWEKLQYLIQQNNLAHIQHLAQFLPAKEKQQLRFWYKVHNQPLLIEQTEQFDDDNTIDRKILLDGIQRLAVKYPNELAETWPLLNKMYVLTESERQHALSTLAVSLARHADLDADTWLKQIKPRYSDTVLREWRVRNQLLKGDWKKVLYWLDHLSSSEKKMPCWRYWRARALAENHQVDAANSLYHDLARQVDYYGVLASQRLKQPYHPKIQRIGGDNVALQQNPAIQRAQELYALGFNGDARREWQWALHSLSQPQLQAAAQLAKKWKWYDLAIIGAAKAKIHNDIKLRFPMAYRSSVLSVARKTHLNSAWIWAIMRQESAFMWNAKSSAGALGLMQIMPATGKNLAKQLNLHTINLLNSELNIRLGTTYLKHLLKVFDGNAVLATAAYNVGPTRIKNYQTLYHRLPNDVWVEILPWKETRDYIKSVSLARSIYGQV
ncbi:MAG: transglycosylase SLT domain-containing protein [Rickettsiella sp.]|nr:transglycosylase SLT domain-containing protein [Rickettsiella sp.]